MFYDLFFYIIFLILMFKFDFFTPAIDLTKNISNYKEYKTLDKKQYLISYIQKIEDFFKQDFFDFFIDFIKKKHTREKYIFIYSVLLIYAIIFILKQVKKINNPKMETHNEDPNTNKNDEQMIIKNVEDQLNEVAWDKKVLEHIQRQNKVTIEFKKYEIKEKVVGEDGFVDIYEGGKFLLFKKI